MNLYLISQEQNENYDTYDSAVVAADSPEAARVMHPMGKAGWRLDARNYCSRWAAPEFVTVKLVGVALPDAVAGVVCASYNAG